MSRIWILLMNSLTNILLKNIQIRTVNLLHFFSKFYIWRSKFIANYCRLECLLQYMIFSACVKWEIFLWYKINFNMWRWILQKMLNIWFRNNSGGARAYYAAYTSTGCTPPYRRIHLYPSVSTAKSKDTLEYSLISPKHIIQSALSDKRIRHYQV